MADFAERLGVGPWFLRGPFQPPRAATAAQPTHARPSSSRAPSRATR